jgi:hypothetical protein
LDRPTPPTSSFTTDPSFHPSIETKLSDLFLLIFIYSVFVRMASADVLSRGFGRVIQRLTNRGRGMFAVHIALFVCILPFLPMYWHNGITYIHMFKIVNTSLINMKITLPICSSHVLQLNLFIRSSHTTKKMILRHTARTLTETITKSNRLVKYLRIFGGKRFIYGGSHTWPPRKMHLRRWTSTVPK